MDVVLLSRIQFALTSIFHYFYVPVTIGMTVFLAVLETSFVVTKNEKYRLLSKFWGKIFIINFAIGVVTGIVQEFQFGMNWSEYSRFVGDVFGGPLAIEALVAFFMESTFIGVWLWGRNLVSPRVYAASIWLVALGTNLSAFWILVANSWMQNPVGFDIVNGKATLTSIVDLVSNSYVWRQFPHVILSAWLTACFLVLGVSAYRLLKNRSDEYFKTSFKFASCAGLIIAVLLMFEGHLQAQYITKKVPMKMAAAEALWESKDPAPFSIFSIPNEKERSNSASIEIPAFLSFLAYNKFSGEVKGINDLEKEAVSKYGPGDYVPPVFFTYFAFRAMIAAGVLMLLLSLVAAWYACRQKEAPSWFLTCLVWAIVLPFIGNTSGWALAEMGRYPWMVHGIVDFAKGVTPSNTALDVAISLVVFTLVYGTGTLIWGLLIAKYAKNEVKE